MGFSGKRIAAALLLLVFATLSGCASHRIEAEKLGQLKVPNDGPFRERWWNYYERANTRINVGSYQEAIADLEIALSKRSNDARRARTYGMHFIDYFPHRELGYIYLQQGRLKAAENELLTSIAQFPSAKASFYLNRVRSEKLKQNGSDKTPPSIILENEAELQKPTNALTLTLRGSAADDNFVAALSIQGKPERIEQAESRIMFERTVELQPGTNRIDLVASDLSGNQAQRSVQIMVDREAPQLSVDITETRETKDGKQEVQIGGTVWDEQPVCNLHIADQQVAVAPATGKFFVRLVVPARKHSVAFTVEDTLGNRGDGNIEINDSRVAQASRPILLAAASPAYLSDTPRLTMADFEKHFLSIQIKDIKEKQEVFLDSIYLEGSALDDRQVAQVKVNGVPVLRRPGRQVFFGILMPLKVGENAIEVTAEDTDGNSAIKRLQIIRKQPEIYNIGKRISLSLLPLEKKGQAGVVSDIAEEYLMNAMVEQRRFQLVERARLASILQEQKLSASDLVDPATAVRIGKIIAARLSLMGSAIETGRGIEMVVRLVDTETSEIIATKDAYDEDKSPPNVMNLMTGLAFKLQQAYPMVQATLIKRSDKTAWIDKGSNAGIRNGMRLLSYRQEKDIVHPVTGKILGSETVITGELKVIHVADDFATCEIVSEKAPSNLSKMQQVITR